ncbi:hypothetical protein chiPu_0012391 [Chiloscyllium punctatum]|uniref:Peroxiredoxin-like 2A n=1 Tax=Chiloscyllium punctatum TaxID=137246 RepID=A0A401SU43_CHIPU|nr:hypothetical protein [Chiloscyllium punctatum]
MCVGCDYPTTTAIGCPALTCDPVTRLQETGNQQKSCLESQFHSAPSARSSRKGDLRRESCGCRLVQSLWQCGDLDDSCAERRPPKSPLSNPSLTSEIFLDEEKRFYGPNKRTMGLLGLLRLGVWRNFLRAWRKGFGGNTDGEGFILGGVFVVGAGDQGVLLEHREKEFGDAVDIHSVLEAARKVRPLRNTDK